MVRITRWQRRTTPSGRAVAGSFAVHGLVIVVALFADTVPDAPELQMVRVRMLAVAPEDAPIRVDPAPPETAEQEERPPPPDETPDPAPEVERPTVEEEVPQPVEPEPEPARREEIGEETVNVQTDGANFAFPAYLENIITQVQRHWRVPAGSRDERAEVSFVITRDGSVSEISWISRSGNPSFDLAARGAIEAAGNRRAFGPLPELFPGDRLRVQFYFDPSSR